MVPQTLGPASPVHIVKNSAFCQEVNLAASNDTGSGLKGDYEEIILSVLCALFQKFSVMDKGEKKEQIC